MHKVRDGSLFTTLKYLQQTIERKWLLTNTSEEYQVSQKSVRLCTDLPSCKRTLFWDTLYIELKTIEGSYLAMQ